MATTLNVVGSGFQFLSMDKKLRKIWTKQIAHGYFKTNNNKRICVPNLEQIILTLKIDGVSNTFEQPHLVNLEAILA